MNVQSLLYVICTSLCCSAKQPEAASIYRGQQNSNPSEEAGRGQYADVLATLLDTLGNPPLQLRAPSGTQVCAPQVSSRRGPEGDMNRRTSHKAEPAMSPCHVHDIHARAEEHAAVKYRACIQWGPILPYTQNHI